MKMKSVRGLLCGTICWMMICWMMIVFVPASLMAAGSGVGMARPYGTAWVNGAAVERSSAIFPGDVVQTNSSSALKISSSGSSVTVLSDSLVKFEGGAVSIERGGVKLVTSTSMFAHAGSVTATPASSARTEFELTNVNGKVQVVALKGDVQISDGSQTAVLSQGQQATQTQSQRHPSAAIPSSAKETTNAGFIVGTAASRSTDAVSRNVEAATDRGLEAAKAAIAVKISPTKP